MNTSTLNIKNGPSKMDIMTAFAYAYDDKHPFEVEFELESGEKFRAQIVSIEHESGSGNSLNIGCFVSSRTGEPNVTNVYGVMFPSKEKRYKIYYNVANRKGATNLESPVYLPFVEKTEKKSKKKWL